jgi:DNA-binding winged helix-turn-helix (wHTH) protein/TolB-like protein
MSNEFNPLREFGKFRLDLEKKFLWCDEKPVQLPLKAVELLCVLVESKDTVVTKDEIWQKVWQNSFVEETNLTHNIYLLRKTFKDLGERDLIQTVPRRGYRFAGDVREFKNGKDEIIIERRVVSQTLIEEIPAPETEIEPQRRENTENFENKNQASRKLPGKSAAARKQLILAAMVLLAVFLTGAIVYLNYRALPAKTSLAEIESIAVLPLRNLSENEDDKTLSLGLTDALISKLGGLNRFAVRPLGAAQKYKEGEIDALTLGAELKVDAVLEGSLQAANNRLRVNVRLLRVEDGSQILAGSFDENETDIFKLQDLLSAQVAKSLIERLSPQEQKQLASRPTENIEAYKLYLKGRYFWNERTVESYFKAIGLFEQAIEIDPNFALGYSGIADCYALLEQRGGLPPEEAFPKAEQVARKALELDETLAEAHVSMALVKNLYRWEWIETETHVKRAIELNPNYAPAYGLYGMSLLNQKRFEEAEAQLKKAEHIDPTSRSNGIYLAWKFYFARQFDEAISQSRKVLELDDTLTTPYMVLRAAFEQKGMFDEAVEAELKRLKNSDSQTVESLKDSYRKSGIRGFWQKQIEIFRKKINPSSEVADYHVATRFALLDRRDEALREIENGFINRGSMWHQISVEPAFDSLRDDARFQTLLRKLNLPK